MKHADHVGLLRPADLPTGGAWADLGAGSGAFTLALRELVGAGAIIHAVDKDQGSLRELEHAYMRRFNESGSLHRVEADFTAGLDLPALDGVLMANSLHFHRDMVVAVQKTMKSAFPVVDLYTTPIATYAGNWWTFSVGSKKPDPREIRSKKKIKTKYYSHDIHRSAFLPMDMYAKLLSGKLGW